jgi:uncharacterized protein (TIGR03083 family)
MNAADVLMYGHRTVLRSVEGLPEGDWETPGACGRWSVKNIIAHLASYELVLADILGGFLGGGPTPALDAFCDRSVDFNDAQVDARQSLSVAATLEEYSATCARTAALAAQIPAETYRLPGTLPWYGAEYALDDLIVYMYYGHKREHCAQIAAFRDTLARQGAVSTEARG